MTPEVEVVVITYRSGDHLAACLQSLEGHSVVVIDNASDDHSAAVARSHGCRVVVNHHNQGFARTVNQAMALTTAPLVAFVNPDAVVDQHAIANLALSMDHGVGVASAHLVNPSGSAQRPDWPFPSASAHWREAFGLHRRYDQTAKDAAPYDVESVVGACMLIRREAFTAVGGFDERFWLYGEETDFCARLQRDGWRRVVVPTATAFHIGGASAGGSAEVATHFFDGSDRFVLLHAGRAALASYRLATLVGSLLRLPLLALRNPHDTRVQTRWRAVRHALQRLLKHPLSVPTRPLEGVDQIVLCSLEGWDTTWRRNQLFVQQLVTDAALPTRVLFIEPPLDVLHTLLTKRRIARRTLSLGTPQPGMPGVTTFRPRKILPRIAGKWADRSLMRQVKAATRHAGFGSPTLWLNDSTYAPLLCTKRPWPAVYDITDDWLHENVPPREQRRRVLRERLLMARADRVVVCSPALAADRSRSRKVVTISNAVDVDHFRSPHTRPTDLPSAPVALYVGTLHRERLDLDLVVQAARHLPHVNFTFVGPNALTDGEEAPLRSLPNVHLLGARPYIAVPGYLQHCDVFIVPHVVTPFTESLDPIKLYECRAVGVPTLATPVAGFRDSPWPTIRVAERTVFAETLATLFAEPPDRRPDPSTPTWVSQATLFRAELDAAADRSRRLLRVVYLGHTAQRSGGELALLRLFEGLPDVHKHVILAEDGPMVPLIGATGATVELLPLAPRARDLRRERITIRTFPFQQALATLGYVFTLRRRLRELRPDIVHTNTLKAALYGGAAARLAGVPVVWHVRDRIADDYLPSFAVRMVRTLTRWVPNAVITNSSATLETLGKRPRRANVVPSPVVYDAVPTAGFSDQTATSERRDFRIGLMGRISPWKGQDVFLRAFAAADLPTSSSAVLIGSAMFGEEEYERSLHRLAEDLGITDRVYFRGFVDDVPRVLAEIDVLVHASTIPEPFGQVVIEGMAAGLPVIAADAGGPREVITNEVDGLLVAPNDVAALAQALSRLAGDAELRRTLGAAGRQRAADFTPSRVGEQVMLVYRTLMAGRA